MADDLIERVARAVSQAMLGHDIVPDDLNQPYTEGSKLGTVMRIAMAATEVQSREIAALREALIETGRHAGAVLSDDVSTEFLLLIPNEVKLKLQALKDAR